MHVLNKPMKMRICDRAQENPPYVGNFEIWV